MATDPDREGEAISWHLLYALKLDPEKTARVTFNEITKDVVKKSIKEAREIDMDLVNAQQARRELDRIVGYKISPLLWKKVKKGLSAGRVQSVALKLICEREEEIENFVPQEYWSIDSTFKTTKGKKFPAKFYGDKKGKIELNTKEETDKILKAVENADFTVEKVKKSVRAKNAPAPFTTSTMQQEASKLLGFAPQKTMRIAQQLYEGVDIEGEGTVGLVSYIRTDSVRISDEAYEQAKDVVSKRYGEEYLREKKQYKTDSSAQDAHEAIRPTVAQRYPDSIKESLSRDQYKLYKLIWERFMASQMMPAKYATVSADIDANDYIFRATGSTLMFDGYLAVYKKNEELDDEKAMPEIQENDTVVPVTIEGNQHFTQPPARYSEALLIKTLDDIKVGRPSTLAPTIATILARNYVTKEKKLLYSTELGEIVNEILTKNFEPIINAEFTADMEKELDSVEEGELNWKKLINDFYPSFKDTLEKAQKNIEKIQIKDEESDVVCEKCGRKMVYKLSKFGKFLACPGYPECKNTKAIREETGAKCPKCGGEILVKKSRRGKVYYGCEHSPKCDFMVWDMPVKDEACPQCGGLLLKKQGRNGKIFCYNEDCKYERKLKDEKK